LGRLSLKAQLGQGAEAQQCGGQKASPTNTRMQIA
jgi:hypothetical protein